MTDSVIFQCACAKLLYFYFRSEIWRHRRVHRPYLLYDAIFRQFANIVGRNWHIYVCIDFQDLLAQNGGFWGKIGEGAMRCWPPQRTRSYFWGLFRRCHFWRKSIKKCDRESVDRQTDRRTHRVTETNWIHNLSHAICYSYVADNKLLKMEIKTCYMYYSLLVAFKSDVDTWNRRRR